MGDSPVKLPSKTHTHDNNNNKQQQQQQQTNKQTNHVSQRSAMTETLHQPNSYHGANKHRRDIEHFSSTGESDSTKLLATGRSDRRYAGFLHLQNKTFVTEKRHSILIIIKFSETRTFFFSKLYREEKKKKPIWAVKFSLWRKVKSRARRAKWSVVGSRVLRRNCTGEPRLARAVPSR